MKPLPRSVAVPVFWYLALTLGVPLFNGAAAHRAFWGHAAVVAAVVGTLVALRWGGAVAIRRGGSGQRARGRAPRLGSSREGGLPAAVNQ
jgi:hypothetical protein